jgi:REP element-mobilizing transposase RayT
VNSASFAKPSETRPYGKRHALPEIIRAFKLFSAIRINVLRGTEGMSIWQRNYYEHIIRDDEEHNRIHLYIEANVDNWGTDEENPRR